MMIGPTFRQIHRAPLGGFGDGHSTRSFDFRMSCDHMPVVPYRHLAKALVAVFAARPTHGRPISGHSRGLVDASPGRNGFRSVSHCLEQGPPPAMENTLKVLLRPHMSVDSCKPEPGGVRQRIPLPFRSYYFHADRAVNHQSHGLQTCCWRLIYFCPLGTRVLATDSGWFPSRPGDLLRDSPTCSAHILRQSKAPNFAFRKSIRAYREQIVDRGPHAY